MQWTSIYLSPIIITLSSLLFISDKSDTNIIVNIIIVCVFFIYGTINKEKILKKIKFWKKMLQTPCPFIPKYCSMCLLGIKIISLYL